MIQSLPCSSRRLPFLHGLLLVALGLCLGITVAFGQTGSVVTVNSDNVLVINGQKVFPIGFSPGPPNNSTTPQGKDALQEFRDAGALLIRINQTNDWNSALIAQQQAALDWAAQHGMFVWLNLRELSQFSSTDTTTPANLRYIVDTFRDHPALGLWKNFDEAWWAGVSVSSLSNGYYVIKQEDLNHPVVQTHAPRGTVTNLQPYNVAADVLAMDIYPVAVPPPTNPPITNTGVSQLGDWTQVLSQVANGQKEYWMIEQIAFSGTTPPNHILVFPTFTQSRYMAYEAIINGARGLMFFGGNIDATLNTQDKPYGWNWTFWTNVLKPVVLELGDKGMLTDALLTTNSTLPVTMSGTTYPDVEFIVREVPPYLYLVASKRDGSNSVNITFSGLPAGAGAGQVLYEWPRMVTAQNGQFTDTFAPLEVHVYRFNLTTAPPLIAGQPQSRTDTIGTSATFTVTATGTGPLSYQWLKNAVVLTDGGNLYGSANATLTLTNVQPSDSGTYSVVVSNSAGLTVSADAVLTVPGPVSIAAQPASLTNNAGTAASFSVSVSGPGPQYQWSKNGVNLGNGGNISGATSPTLLLGQVFAADAGSYSVVVSNPYSSVTSAAAQLTVVDPVILSQPASLKLNPGTTAVFAASAGGTPPVTYRWQKGGTNLSDGGNVSGSTTPTLALPNVQPSDAGSYSLVVSNSVGSVTSTDAVLTVSVVMPYYEPFSYPVGSNLGGQVNSGVLNWNDVGTSTAGPYVTNYAGSLSLSGFLASSGNSMRFGGLGKSARLSFAPGGGVTSGTVYYSFLLKVLDTTGLSSSGIFFAGFNNSTGGQSTQPTVVGARLYARSASGGFNLGIAKNSGTSSDWYWDPRVFTNSQVIFVVGSYTFNLSNSYYDVCSLWLNPSASSFGAATPPDGPVTAVTGADIGDQIVSFVFLQRNTAEPALMQADELRIGTSWASVTGLPTTLGNVSRLGNGAFQFSYPNSIAQGGVVYATTNLTNWVALGAATQVSPGVFQFTDSKATNYQKRFYQLRAQ